MLDLKQINDKLINLDKEFSDLSNININEIIEFLYKIKSIVFPHSGNRCNCIEECYQTLKNILINTNNIDSEKICNGLFKALPEIKEVLLTDVEAFVKGDPASNSKEEIIFTYLSFFAIFTYRISHKLSELNARIVPRFLAEYAHSYTGIDINPKAKIGKYFFIDHGTGTVIGETAEIGNHVSIYQGVTLGAISLSDADSLRGIKRHPTVEDNVTIYANATILGGKTVIGEGSIIGASTFITKSVDKNSKVSFNIK